MVYLCNYMYLGKNRENGYLNRRGEENGVYWMVGYFHDDVEVLEPLI